MVDGQQPTFVSGIPPTFPLRTSSLYSLCLRRISPLQQKGFKSRQYWKRIKKQLSTYFCSAIWHSLLMDNWFIFACQHQALWPVATLVKVQRPRVNCSLALHPPLILRSLT